MGRVPQEYCQGNGAFISRVSGRLCLLRITFRCSERPIICAKMKAWLCQRSQILLSCDVTRRQRPIRDLVSLTLQRSLCNNMRRTRRWAIRRSQPVQVDRLFIIYTCFYLPKFFLLTQCLSQFIMDISIRLLYLIGTITPVWTTLLNILTVHCGRTHIYRDEPR